MADNDTAKVDIYEPTTAELKLLEILCNPEYATKNVTEICSAADVVRDVYYDAFKKDGFKSLIKQTSLDLVKSRLVQVINATIDYAINNSRCSNDRKTILQMADMITEKVEHSGEIKLPNIIIK